MKRLTFALIFALQLTACPRREERLTLAEAQQALEESAAASQAEGLTATSVDLATTFTIGGGIEQATEQLRTFLANQLPCAEVTTDGATLSVEYGVNPGNCLYRGHELSGTASITVSRNDDQEVLVEHEWIGLSNGIIDLDGTASITWDFEARTRRVVHETRWTSRRSGRTVTGEGDRLQSVLEGGILEGLRVNGSRSWEGERGSWDLAIDGVELRWADPIPQAGTYTLATPFDKTLSMNFSRVDEDTIRVTVASATRDFSFTVSKLGVVEREAP